MLLLPCSFSIFLC
ncbi:hypothetical protein F383_35530 [Gossypium arboreum]|uniref:Uncharacterized protein n=1 Tax=Gossypium arboreum TaxID=29729 RepID=A0A0B0N242_GOSAR|nr:hypothetical protein F383_35530 [Gossypium arboreum]